MTTPIPSVQIGWWVGLATCVCGALVGQAELIGEPWRHWISVLFIVLTAASAYMLKPPSSKE